MAALSTDVSLTCVHHFLQPADIGAPAQPFCHHPTEEPLLPRQGAAYAHMLDQHEDAGGKVRDDQERLLTF